MTRKTPAAGLFWPTLLSIVGLAVLLGLGTWQMRRLAWKDGLIAQIAERTKATPISLDEALQRAAAGKDIEYLRIRTDGRWRHDKEQYLWTPEKSGPGWQVFTPLLTPSGTQLIVNRGFVADADRDRARRPEPGDTAIRLVGLLRRPEARAAFAPDNDPVRNRWYWRDFEGMKKAMELDGGARTAPYFLDAEPSTPEVTKANPRLPRGGATRLDLPNSHLQYALTWYGLALTLVGVYAAFARGRLRQARGERESDG